MSAVPSSARSCLIALSESRGTGVSSRRSFSHNGCGAKRDGGDARGEQHNAGPARPRQRSRCDRHNRPSSARVPKSRPRASISTRQREARRQAGDGEAGDREARELREPDDAREQERRDTRCRCSRRRWRAWATAARAISRGLASGAAMAEEMNRIVLRDADQREAERERDAMHGAEHRAHRGQARDAGGRERQGAQARRCRRCDTRAAASRSCRSSQPRRATEPGPRARLHQHREIAGAAHGQCRTVCVAASLLQRLLELGERRVAGASGSNAAALRCREQQRALRRRDRTTRRTRDAAPAPVASAAAASSSSSVGSRGSQRLENAPAGDDRSCAALERLAVQIVRIERLRVERRRQQEAVGQQLVGNASSETSPLVTTPKLRVCRAARRRARATRRRALGASAPSSATSSTRDAGPFADLLEQQPLLGRDGLGQEQAASRR